MQKLIENYITNLSTALTLDAFGQVPILATALEEARCKDKYIYLCGNGGSAGNATHIANDFLFGIGLRVESLSANPSVLTCLANDLGYDSIYSEQIKVKGAPGDILIALSGSGNSPNIVKALETANTKNMKTFAILGFVGGRCKEVAQHSIHFAVNDMQIAEDLQLIVAHILMQWLRDRSSC